MMLKDPLKQEYYKQYYQGRGFDVLNKKFLLTLNNVIQQNKSLKNT